GQSPFLSDGGLGARRLPFSESCQVAYELVVVDERAYGIGDGAWRRSVVPIDAEAGDVAGVFVGACHGCDYNAPRRPERAGRFGSIRRLTDRGSGVSSRACYLYPSPTLTLSCAAVCGLGPSSKEMNSRFVAACEAAFAAGLERREAAAATVQLGG